MIVRNDLLQCLECTICRELVEIRMKSKKDPERMLRALEEMQAGHAPCEEFKDDPRRALLEREYRVRMCVELAGLKR